MADSTKLYWLGVSFDPDEDISEMSYLAEQNETIARFLHENGCELMISSQQGNIYTETYQNPDVFEGADLVDVWFEDKARIGFGFIVEDLQGERTVEPAMRKWFGKIGVSLYVSLYEFDAADTGLRKPRPAGVDDMVSLDLI